MRGDITKELAKRVQDAARARGGTVVRIAYIEQAISYIASHGSIKLSHDIIHEIRDECLAEIHQTAAKIQVAEEFVQIVIAEARARDEEPASERHINEALQRIADNRVEVDILPPGLPTFEAVHNLALAIQSEEYLLN